jgi:hypothetical protein
MHAIHRRGRRSCRSVSRENLLKAQLSSDHPLDLNGRHVVLDCQSYAVRLIAGMSPNDCKLTNFSTSRYSSLCSIIALTPENGSLTAIGHRRNARDAGAGVADRRAIVTGREAA